MLRALCLLFLCAMACGARSPGAERADGGEDAAAADAATDTEAMCRAFAAALCEKRWECVPLAFTRGYGFGDAFGTEERCVERTTLACRGWGLLPGTTASPAAIDKCTAEFAARDCRTSTQTLTRPTAGCAFASGTLGADATCVAALQCASGTCLSGGPDAALWKCAAPAVDPPPVPELGTPCATASDCRPDLVCWAGTCQAPALLGEACGAERPACAEYAELRCDEAGTCSPHPTSPSACGDRAIDNSRFAACETGECVGRNDFGLGHCAPYANDGAPCDPYAGPACLYPARCMNKVCRVPGF